MTAFCCSREKLGGASERRLGNGNVEMQQQRKPPEASGAASADTAEPAKAKGDKQQQPKPAQDLEDASDTERLLQHRDGVPQEHLSPANMGSDATDAEPASAQAKLHDGGDKKA